MLKKHIILLGIIISLAFLEIATLYYPGGSQFEKDSVGYSWSKNYLCNLVTPAAVNGAGNTARPWTICSLVILCVCFGLFFWRVSKKMPTKSAAAIIKYSGIAGMILILLIVTPYHDTAITVAAACTLLSIFYLTVFLFKSKSFFIGVLSVVCMLFFYCSMYMYFTQTGLVYLPAIQKAWFFILIAWVLCLEYFTTVDDYQPRKFV